MEFNYEEYKKRTRKVESGGNDSAKNPNSSASGRYQFTKGTWEGLGFDWGQRFDPVMQERAMEKFTNNNVNYFKKNFKKEPTYADTYGMHFLGSAGYKQVYSATDSTPIEQVVTPGAYSANKSVFSKYKTVGEFKGWLRSKAGEGSADTKNNTPSAEVAPQQTAQLITPELQTMERVRRDEVVDLSFAEKAEEAKQAIQQYQTQEDLIAQMPMQSEQTITPQQVEQRPNYDYLFNQDLFQLT